VSKDAKMTGFKMLVYEVNAYSTKKKKEEVNARSCNRNGGKHFRISVN
jgi:hypothetical protein